MKNKLTGSYYPKCNSKKTSFLKSETLDGEIYVNNGNLVFQRKILWFFKGNIRLKIPLKDIERVENCNLNEIFPYGVCIYTKDNKEYMLGHINNKKLQDFVLNAKAGVVDGIIEKKINNKKNKIINTTLATVIILIFALTAIFAFNNIKQENIIKNELEIINGLHASKDTISMDIKASGDYGKVEKAMKEYYTDYFVNKKIFNNNRAEVLFNTLTVSYLKENKNKLKSLKLEKMVDDKTKELNEAVDNIVKMLESHNIMSYVYKYDLKLYYNNFYRDNMISENDESIQEEWKNLMEENTKKADYLKQIINILVDNNNDWYVENDMLYFSDDKLLNMYNNLHSLIYGEESNDNTNDLII